MEECINPLQDGHCRTLDTVLNQCPLTKEYLEKLKRCGLDTDELIAECERQNETAKAIKREFFPDRS